MYKIIIDHAPNQADNEVIKDRLFAAHKDLIGEPDKQFSVFLKDEAGKVVGGI